MPEPPAVSEPEPEPERGLSPTGPIDFFSLEPLEDEMEDEEEDEEEEEEGAVEAPRPRSGARRRAPRSPRRAAGDLESRSLADLHAMAAAAGIQRYRLLRRQELIERLGAGGKADARRIATFRHHAPQGLRPAATPNARRAVAAVVGAAGVRQRANARRAPPGSRARRRPRRPSASRGCSSRRATGSGSCASTLRADPTATRTSRATRWSNSSCAAATASRERHGPLADPSAIGRWSTCWR